MMVSRGLLLVLLVPKVRIIASAHSHAPVRLSIVSIVCRRGDGREPTLGAATASPSSSSSPADASAQRRRPGQRRQRWRWDVQWRRSGRRVLLVVVRETISGSHLARVVANWRRSTSLQVVGLTETVVEVQLLLVMRVSLERAREDVRDGAFVAAARGLLSVAVQRAEVVVANQRVEGRGRGGPGDVTNSGVTTTGVETTSSWGHIIRRRWLATVDALVAGIAEPLLLLVEVRGHEVGHQVRTPWPLVLVVPFAELLLLGELLLLLLPRSGAEIAVTSGGQRGGRSREGVDPRCCRRGRERGNVQARFHWISTPGVTWVVARPPTEHTRGAATRTGGRSSR